MIDYSGLEGLDCPPSKNQGIEGIEFEPKERLSTKLFKLATKSITSKFNRFSQKPLKVGDFITLTYTGSDPSFLDNLFEVTVIDGRYVRGIDHSSHDFLVTLRLDDIRYDHMSKEFVDSVINDK